MAKRQRRRRQDRRREHASRKGWQTRHSVITGVGVAATASLGIATGAQAASAYYYVGSTDDTALGGDCTNPSNTDCTLRDAINAANANSGYADTIYFSSTISGTPIVMGGAPPVIDDPVYIVGNGPSDTIVSGDHQYRAFDIDMTNGGDPVGIYSMTLRDGYADDGGAIFNHDASLTISDARLTGNVATDNGGAIYEHGGGGSHDDPYYGTGNFIGYSTIAGNFAGTDGGGIYGYYSAGTVGTSTISGNIAGRFGGGISTWSPNFTYSSTITGNRATGAGGVVNKHDPAGLYNSIVGGNVGPFGADAGGEFYASFDLIKSTAGTTLHPGTYYVGPNITGVDPQLGTLGLHGGDTPNFRPAATSPVVDKGLSYSSDDQRSVERPIDIPWVSNAPGGDGGDIGSVELTLAEGPPKPPAPTPTPTPTPTPAPTFNLKKAVKKCKKKYKRAVHKKRAHDALTPQVKRKLKKKRTKCIKRARRKAGVASAARWRSERSSSPWAKASDRWAKRATARGAHDAFLLHRH